MKNHFRNFHQILHFEAPWVRKNDFFEIFCLYLFVNSITLDRIIGLDWNLTHLWSSQKEKKNSLINHFLPMALVFSIKDVFVKIKNSIFSSKYTRYGKNVQEQDSLFQRDLQIPGDHFIRIIYFHLFIKNVFMKMKN